MAEQYSLARIQKEAQRVSVSRKIPYSAAYAMVYDKVVKAYRDRQETDIGRNGRSFGRLMNLLAGE